MYFHNFTADWLTFCRFKNQYSIVKKLIVFIVAHLALRTSVVTSRFYCCFRSLLSLDADDSVFVTSPSGPYCAICVTASACICDLEAIYDSCFVG